MKNPRPFKWRHFEAEIILICLRWYLRYALRYRDLEEMMVERGLSLDHTTIYRWVQRSAPDLEKRCRPYLKACNDSWSGDETSITIRKAWFSLYRAGDSEGNTLEFLLSSTRDAQAATRFFCKALHATVASTRQTLPRKERMALTDAITPSVPRVSTSIQTQPIPGPLPTSKRVGSCLKAWYCGWSRISIPSLNKIIVSSRV